MSAPILMWRSVYRDGFVITSNGTLWIAMTLTWLSGIAGGLLLSKLF